MMEERKTAYAIAMDAIHDHGCDCGTDGPGTCLACVCRLALLAERMRAISSDIALAAVRSELAEVRGLLESVTSAAKVYHDADARVRNRTACDCPVCTALSESLSAMTPDAR